MTDTAAVADLSWVPAEPNRETFAYRARLLRNELGLTTKEIGALCDVSHTTWSSWEAGHSPRNMDAVVRKIHEATSVSANWLMWGSTVLRKLDATHLTGLPTLLDHRYRSTTDRPIMQLVPRATEDDVHGPF